tara:strand:+ start:478 stop:1674 length:1197 start_codon:yes stop_codon:yes gene_type:complete
MGVQAMNARLNIRLVYVYVMMINTIFILPVLLPYFQTVLGLEFRHLLMGEALFAAVVIAMEVPSGWLSDVWSRKGTLIAGCFFSILGYCGMLFVTNFWSVMFFMGIMGVGVAFNSGTVTAIIYDTLATKGKIDAYQRLEGKRHAIALYSVAGAALTGGLLFQIHPKLPLAFDAGSQVIALICACLITEPPRVKRSAEKNPIYDMMVTIKYALHGHKEIGGIILVSTILFCTTKMFLWMQQPYMQHVGIPVFWFGFVSAAGFLFGGFLGHYGHVIKHGLGNRMVIACMTCIPIFAAFLASVFQVPFSILFILIVSGVWGFGFPFVQNAINKHADPARRATILSTLGLLINLVFIPTSFVLGWLTDHYSIITGLMFVAIQLMILGSLGLWLWQRGAREKL